MRWWLSRLSSCLGAKSSREHKPKWLPGLHLTNDVGLWCIDEQQAAHRQWRLAGSTIYEPSKLAETDLVFTLVDTQMHIHSQTAFALCGAGASSPFPLVHLLRHLLFFFTFPLFHWLYLFSSFVHPFPFYQNSPTPVSRPEVVGSDRTWV